MMSMESGLSPRSRSSTRAKRRPEMRVWALLEKMALLPLPSSGMSAKRSCVSSLAVPTAKGFWVLDCLKVGWPCPPVPGLSRAFLSDM